MIKRKMGKRDHRENHTISPEGEVVSGKKKKRKSGALSTENQDIEGKVDHASVIEGLENTTVLHEKRKWKNKKKKHSHSDSSKEDKISVENPNSSVSRTSWDDETGSVAAVYENEASLPEKHKKKKDSESGLSEDISDKTSDLKQDCSAASDENETKNELEEIRKQKRKEKKKRKKIRKLKEGGNSATPENQEAAPNACHLALQYLAQWEKDREHWRFQKVRQVWLLQHMYDKEKGKSRETTLAEAQKVISLDEDSSEEASISETRLERARQLIQALT